MLVTSEHCSCKKLTIEEDISAEAENGDFCNADGTITAKCNKVTESCQMEGNLEADCRVQDSCMCSHDKLSTQQLCVNVNTEP